MLGLYCVARYKRGHLIADREFVEYGAPFVAYSDETACFEVREAVKEHKDMIDLTLFAVVKVADFCPDSYESCVVGHCVDVICPDCSALFEVEVNEQE